MIEFHNKFFSRLFSEGGVCIEDLSFKNCMFEDCGFSLARDITRIPVIRRVELVDCAINGCIARPLVASDVKISNLRTNDLLILWSPFVDRVVLSGEIGKMKINVAAHPTSEGTHVQRHFDDFRTRFYSSVDWALDISNARFKEFDIRGVPGRLIRRDPESQVLITRERALQVAVPGWEKQLDPANELWPFMVEMFLGKEEADTVFVAPLGAAKSQRDSLLKGLQELRRIGLAEPD